MAHGSSVRRVPMLLTVLAAGVVVLSLLGVAGVIERPETAYAGTTSAAGAGGPAGDATDGANGVGDIGSDADDPTHAPLAAAGAELAASTADLVTILHQPSADSSQPAAVDTALVPPTIEPAPAEPTALPADSGDGRRIVYSINGQRVWLVEADGRVNRTYLVSGRLDAPAVGSYAVYAKSPTGVNADGSLQLKHLLRFLPGGGAALGFHDIPVRADGTAAQPDASLGQPLSGGSVRQSEADAAFLWDWAVLGTVVVVVP